MKQFRSFILLIFVGIMWWGLIYPELCFVEGTYERAAGISAELFGWQEENTGEKTDEEAFFELLEAGPDRIIIKSKIMRK
ncbi:MAG: hypothetical protein K2K54_05645 [Lachnospiraceae bacterium]|nr:hypothetical protein [Lachnospiraceae bacterium]